VSIQGISVLVQALIFFVPTLPRVPRLRLSSPNAGLGWFFEVAVRPSLRELPLDFEKEILATLLEARVSKYLNLFGAPELVEPVHVQLSGEARVVVVLKVFLQSCQLELLRRVYHNTALRRGVP